ncbi:hypothetical protein AVEN_35555-1 [Araneus ventricosus]|uniref:Uncharacterized protein n=1 Tax=Araneus ventricosus TaxID=182803 RepID=A0A4Y2CK91_ARAVE|nr:hypothetical protein AVEN_35555-1 [Araneus ventricosus]
MGFIKASYILSTRDPFSDVYHHRGSHLDIPSGGVSHRWLAFGYLIGRRVPPVTRIWISHRAACLTFGSHLDISFDGTTLSLHIAQFFSAVRTYTRSSWRLQYSSILEVTNMWCTYP